jgi:hypothetical protein
MGLLDFFGSKQSTPSETGARRYWLFYAGPENYLSDQGICELPQETFWSCEPETRKGDLILVYRKSMDQLSVEKLVQEFGMPQHVANEVKRSKVGKDFPVLWEATSNAQRKFLWHWPYGCETKELRRITPPIVLSELKADPRLRKWEGLRWNLQAQGRSALEIPESAWSVIIEMIDNPKSGPPHSSDKALNPNPRVQRTRGQRATRR